MDMERVEARRPSNRPVVAWWPVVQIEIDRSDRHHDEPAPQREHCVWSSRIRTSRTSLAAVESIDASSTVDAPQSVCPVRRRLGDSQGLPLPGWVRVLGHSPLPRAPGAVWRLSPPLAAPNSQH
ncbi:hypothetical protein MBR_03461, partial [Metarhizium brunneum ARSEF 3297]